VFFCFVPAKFGFIWLNISARGIKTMDANGWQKANLAFAKGS
jgi:hypothetical protein